MHLSLIEFWIYLGISLIIIFILNYIIIIRSWINFINEQRYRNEMYQHRHNDSKQAANDPEENPQNGTLDDEKD